MGNPDGGHVKTSPDLRQARVYVSIRAEAREQKRLLAVLKKHRNGFYQELKKHAQFKYIPHLEFELDPSIQYADEVFQLIDEMKSPPPKHDP